MHIPNVGNGKLASIPNLEYALLLKTKLHEEKDNFAKTCHPSVLGRALQVSVELSK